MSKHAAPEIITCIYCRERLPPSREHALQRSIGGDLVMRLVCVPCNNGFSKIDEALAERSLVALDRVAYTTATAFPVAMGGDHFHFDKDAQLWCDVAVVNGVQPLLLPQVHLVRGEKDQINLSVVATDRDSLERLFDFVSERLASGSLRSTFVKTGPEACCNSAHLTMHRDPPLTKHDKRDGFVRVPRSGDERDFFDLLEKSWADTMAKTRAAIEGGELNQTFIEGPTVNLMIRVRLDDMFRAIAKTAFNLVAVKLGVEFALRPEFDQLRDYIRGIRLVHPPPAAGRILVDGRFVTMCPSGTPPMVPTTEHAITLVFDAPSLVAWVTLYGTQNFVVRLAQLGRYEHAPMTHEFSIDRRGNTALSETAIYKRMRAAATG